jgi:hypothetical protein
MITFTLSADKLAPDFNDLWQIQVIPLYQAIIHALETRIETASNMHDDRLGIARQKIPRVLNIFRHADKNRDLYRVMFGGRGTAMLTVRAQDFLADVFQYDIRNAPQPPEINFNLPEEIEAQLLTGVISRLLYWWLETPNGYTAEQMAAMTYMALYRKQPPGQEVSASY